MFNEEIFTLKKRYSEDFVRWTWLFKISSTSRGSDGEITYEIIVNRLWSEKDTLTSKKYNHFITKETSCNMPINLTETQTLFNNLC